MYRRLLVAISMLAAFAGVAAGARADGDPASDVLATQSLFLAQDAGVPLAQQEALTGLLGTAQRTGYQLRLAVIASPADLGSVSALWRRPQAYARFLAQELALVYRGQVLVAMPNGFGLYVAGRPGSAQPPVPAAVPGGGPSLAVAAIGVVRQLAAEAGHPLPVPRATTPGPSKSGSVIPWVVFAAGLGLVALAWAVSVRARPLRPRNRTASTA